MNFFKISLLFILLGLPLRPYNIEAQTVETPLIGIGTGVAGILDANKMLLGSLEYRSKMQWHGMRPWASLEFGYDLIYVAGGMLAHFNLTENLFLTPGFGMGLYSSHQGIKLGSPLEFKSTIELNYRLNNQKILGISFGHVSNGSLEEKNPGAEILKICYYVPL